jgi:hypothetical protein
MLLMILYRVYVGVVVLFILNALSVSIFSRKRNKLRLIVSAGLLSLVWPLALFSTQGRKILFVKATGL